MKNKSLKEHIVYVENILQKENKSYDWRELKSYNLTQIGFFQHERLIHLLVTLFFGLMFFISVVAELFLLNIGILAIIIILLITLIFYVYHYYFLENSVQKLYKLDEKITKHYQNN